MRRRLLILLFIALSIALITSCDNGDRKTPAAPKGPGKPAYGDTLVEGNIGQPSNLIPILATDGASHDVAGYVYNGLVKYDKNLKLVGDLANSWDISSDGLTITFHLRKGVKWHDGHEFTSRDVLYTYLVTIDPKTPTAYAESFKQVKKAESLDKYTFRVKYDKPYAPALESWGVGMMPAHLLEGKDITKSKLKFHPVGTGPYRFKEWVQGQKVVLESNREYFEGRPYIDRYVYKIVTDAAAMYMELQARTVDTMKLTPIQYQRQTVSPKFIALFNKYRYPDFQYVYLGYNLRNPLFTDKRVRQAITSAISKEEILQGALLGMGQIAHGPYKPGTWAYNPHVKDFGFDPKRAKRLLAEAGWNKKNSEGILVKDGKPFQFTILTNQGNTPRMMAAQIIQQRLKHVGIDVKTRVVEWASFVTQFIDKRNFETVLLGWGIGQDPDIYDIWHSSKTGPKELNFIGYKNPEVDRLLEKGRSTFDLEERKKCYYKIQDILAEDQPYTFLFVPDRLPVVSARFRGIEPAPAGISYDFIKWYVPKNEQVY